MAYQCRSRVVLGIACLLTLAAIAPRATAADQPADFMTITLQRTACLGSCPAYEVTIRGDGHVQFTTATAPKDGVEELHRRFAISRGVLLPGTHEDRVDPAAVDALEAQFEQAGFWDLKDEYSLEATDGSTQTVTLVVGKRKKTVVDYMGTEAGMPQAVRDLEAAIDRVAGTERWVKGSAALIPWLEQTGFDFRSTRATALALDGEDDHADEATVLALIERGAPLDQPVLSSDDLPGPAVLAGSALLEDAIRRGHAEVFLRLAKDGWLDRLGSPTVALIFAQSAAGCSPAMVDALAAAGVNIDLPESHRKSDIGDDPQGETALSTLADVYACHDEKTRVQTAERLLAHGADPNHRDSLGRTPIYGVENLELLNTLLAHGADATARSKDGQSMLFGSWNDAIVLRLLQAGASPAGKYDGGKTLAQQAGAGDMPRVKRWLAAHPDGLHP